jgi:hypothetical protein
MASCDLNKEATVYLAGIYIHPPMPASAKTGKSEAGVLSGPMVDPRQVWTVGPHPPNFTERQIQPHSYTNTSR